MRFWQRLFGDTPSQHEHPPADEEIGQPGDSADEIEGVRPALQRDTSLDRELFGAAENGNASLCLSLIESGADVNYSGSMSETPLHKACSKGHHVVVELLLASGANIFARNQGTRSNPDGDSPLVVSLGWTENHATVARYLLSKGALKRESENGLARLLYWAVRGGHQDTLDLVLAKGGNVNYIYRGDSDRTPLHLAASFGHIEIVKRLMQQGADCLAMSEGGRGEIPLQSSLLNDHGKISDILVEASLAQRNINGETALHLVAKSTYNISTKAVRLLIDHQADVNAKDKMGLTPLHWASADRSERGLGIMKLLLDNGADVNARGKDGWTALHMAAKNDSPKGVELLIASGADVGARDVNGKMPEAVGGSVAMLLSLEVRRKAAGK